MRSFLGVLSEKTITRVHFYGAGPNDILFAIPLPLPRAGALLIHEMSFELLKKSLSMISVLLKASRRRPSHEQTTTKKGVLLLKKIKGYHWVKCEPVTLSISCAGGLPGGKGLLTLITADETNICYRPVVPRYSRLSSRHGSSNPC